MASPFRSIARALLGQAAAPDRTRTAQQEAVRPIADPDTSSKKRPRHFWWAYRQDLTRVTVPSYVDSLAVDSPELAEEMRYWYSRGAEGMKEALRTGDYEPGVTDDVEEIIGAIETVALRYGYPVSNRFGTPRPRYFPVPDEETLRGNHRSRTAYDVPPAYHSLQRIHCIKAFILGRKSVTDPAGAERDGRLFAEMEERRQREGGEAKRLARSFSDAITQAQKLGEYYRRQAEEKGVV